VFQVEAVDVDEGLNGRVEYHLVSGDDEGHFMVDSQLGTLYVASPLDREQVTTKITVTVTHVFSKKATDFN